jgi:Domain of unknown function (DUF4465)/PEP-CTERM motif
MFSIRFHILALLISLACYVPCRADLITIDFSDKTLSGNSYHNGGPTSNSLGWSSGSAAQMYFGNSYSSDFGGYWNGFSYSNVNDSGNFSSGSLGSINYQYSAIPQTGVGGSGVFAIVSAGSHAYFNLPDGYALQAVSLTNTTYAYLAMRNGDEYGFSRPLDRADDFFKVTFTGYDQIGGTGTVLAQVEYSLAQAGTILDSWQQLNLSSLGSAKSIRLSFDSSDRSVFSGVSYVNTPTYVAVDNFILTAVPEPSSLLLAAVAMLGLAGRRRRRC